MTKHASTGFEHDLLLRIVKLLNVTMITIPFALCWFLYYAQHTEAPFYAKGNYLMIALFVVLYTVFGRVYDAFLMSMQRIAEVVYEQFLAAAVSDFVMYIVIWLLTKHLPNILPGVVALGGQVLLSTYGNDVSIRAKAKAAAGSDARMNGCELPVIINSGSGNQGITCSVPLIEYAKELHSGKEKLYRALIISNLVAIHEKTGIGTLSAYCGAVSAGAGAGAGIVYLCGDGYQAAIHTVVNALAIVSGIVCDGAKASCAAKIASSVDAALLGYNMYKCHQEFKGGDGIVMKDIETTIKGIGRLGKDGMKETNEEIIRLMIE